MLTAAKRAAKLIQSITIRHMTDEDPDTSWLGEYSNHATSEFSVDRRHARDCASVRQGAEENSAKLQRAIDYLCQQNLSVSDAVEILEEAQTESTECDCGEQGD